MIGELKHNPFTGQLQSESASECHYIKYLSEISGYGFRTRNLVAPSGSVLLKNLKTGTYYTEKGEGDTLTGSDFKIHRFKFDDHNTGIVQVHSSLWKTYMQIIYPAVARNFTVRELNLYYNRFKTSPGGIRPRNIAPITCTGNMFFGLESITSPREDKLYRSHDGESWTEVSSVTALTNIFNGGVEYHSGTFIWYFVRNISGVSTPAIKRSVNKGKTWTEISISLAGGETSMPPVDYNGLFQIIYANGKWAFFAKGSSSIYAYVSSDDGLTWTPSTISGITGYTASAGDFKYLGTDGTKFYIAVDISGVRKVYESLDAISWTQSLTNGVYAIDYINSNYIVAYEKEIKYGASLGSLSNLISTGLMLFGRPIGLNRITNEVCFYLNPYRPLYIPGTSTIDDYAGDISAFSNCVRNGVIVK